MEITSLQVCMDSSNWLQDTIHEETELDSPSDDQDIFTCSRTLTERKLRPQHDQPLNCPRCDSTHTKFCYYNNYSLSQPRYFCKSCRRYWTKGGTLRNIPVGGGCRKNNKKHSSSKKFSSNDTIHPQITNINQNPIPFPEMEFSHFNNNFVGNNFMVENGNIPTPFDFMMGGSSRNQDFIGNVDHLGMMNSSHGIAQNLNGGLFYGNINYEGQNINIIDDVKPNPKILSLEWHDQQGCSSNVGNRESIGYFNGGSLLGSWTGLMNGYGSSTTNTLV